MSSFQITGLQHEQFAKLFELSNEQLQALGAVRRVADERPGFPCRVSLEDAAIGEELLLLPYTHHAVASPYRASGPIFVRRHALRRTLEAGEMPPYVTRRLISVRAYDRQHMMVAAAVCAGTGVAQQIERDFDNPGVGYIHLHNAKQGCFSCSVNRAAAMPREEATTHYHAALANVNAAAGLTLMDERNAFCVRRSPT